MIGLFGFVSVMSKQHTDSYKYKTQQIIENIVNNVSSKQNELRQGAMKSPSLYSPSVIGDHQIFKEHYRTERGTCVSVQVKFSNIILGI